MQEDVKLLVQRIWWPIQRFSTTEIKVGQAINIGRGCVLRTMHPVRTARAMMSTYGMRRTQKRVDVRTVWMVRGE